MLIETIDPALLEAAGPVREVPAPELGEGAIVLVRPLNIHEQMQIGNLANTPGPDAQAVLHATVTIKACVTADGRPLFEDRQTDALVKSRLLAPLLKRVTEAALDLSGLSERAQENLAKN